MMNWSLWSHPPFSTDEGIWRQRALTSPRGKYTNILEFSLKNIHSAPLLP